MLERCYMWGFKIWIYDGWILNVLVNLMVEQSDLFYVIIWEFYVSVRERFILLRKV